MKKFNDLMLSYNKSNYFLFYYLYNDYSPSFIFLIILQLLEFFQILSCSLYHSVRKIFIINIFIVFNILEKYKLI